MADAERANKLMKSQGAEVSADEAAALREPLGIPDAERRQCAFWDCEGDHRYYSHNPLTGELEAWEME